MPVYHVPLSDKIAAALPLPAKGYAIYTCPKMPGFGVRVTKAGARAWVCERRLDGKTKRITIGPITGRGSIGIVTARKLAAEKAVAMAQGVDPLAHRRAEKRAEREEDAADALTLAVAVRDYVEGKRRGKDGLPLKERTKNDYLAMVAPPRARKGDGKPFKGGGLHSLAETPLAKITADDIRAVYKAQAGERQNDYLMQVLRAVLNWHGVQVPNSPLSKTTAGRDRIVIKPSGDLPNPIPSEKLGAWWNAATATNDRGARGGEAGRFLRIQLLIGCRGGELLDVTMRDVDLIGRRITLLDTKNRTDHIVLLSVEALALVEIQAKGKKPADFLFTITDARKTLADINATAGVEISGHHLRDTFISIADDLCSASTVKRMTNQADAGNVTHSHYTGKSEEQLRAGWQAVSDFVHEKAKKIDSPCHD